MRGRWLPQSALPDENPVPGRTRRGPMPHAMTNDGVKLYYEEVGIGPTIVFVH